MWYPVRSYIADWRVSLFILVQIVLAGAMMISAAIFATPGEVPTLLHYSVDFGVDFAGPWHYVYRIPLLGIAITLVNAFLGYILFYVERQYTYLLLTASTAVMTILAVVLTLIILLNL